MIVYVVTSGSYSDYGIEGIFSTPEGAARLAAEIGCEAQVEEWTMDARAADARRTVWEVGLTDDGRVTRDHSTVEVVRDRYTDTSVSPMAGGWNVFVGKSSVSREHAMKLAAEVRQAHLRKAMETPPR